MTIEYSKKLMEHFLKPKNAGEMKDADGVGEIGNVVCGDILRIYIKVKDNKIVDASFLTYGCVAAIGTTDMLCELVKGKTFEDALKVTMQDVIESLGNIPKIKFHCAGMATEALKKAVEDYIKKQN